MKLISKACFVSQCPAVYEDGDDLVIVGTYDLTDEQYAEVQDKIGRKEQAVRISRALVEAALNPKSQLSQGDRTAVEQSEAVA